MGLGFRCSGLGLRVVHNINNDDDDDDNNNHHNLYTTPAVGLPRHSVEVVGLVGGSGSNTSRRAPQLKPQTSIKSLRHIDR